MWYGVRNIATSSPSPNVTYTLQDCLCKACSAGDTYKLCFQRRHLCVYGTHTFPSLQLASLLTICKQNTGHLLKNFILHRSSHYYNTGTFSSVSAGFFVLFFATILLELIFVSECFLTCSSPTCSNGSICALSSATCDVMGLKYRIKN